MTASRRCKTIQAVIFDLDDTLYDYKALHVESLEVLQERMCEKWNIDKQTFNDLYVKADHKVKSDLANTAASHHKLLYFKYMCEQIAGLDFFEPYNMFFSYWDNIFRLIELNPGAIELIEFCRNQGLYIAICTDQLVSIQYEKIKRLGIGEYIDAFVNSEETGFEKPDKRMYELALTKLNVEKAVMIGDDYERDYIGSQNAGLKAILYDPYGIHINEKYSVRRLYDAIDLLKNI